MKKVYNLLFTACVMLGLTIDAKADHLTAKFLFAARMDGMQEVPAVTTNAVGLAIFSLNDTRDSMCIEMTVNGLSGPITGAHIHEGMMGTNGSVVLDLMPFLNGNRIKGAVAGAAITPQLIDKMFRSMFYINVHTAANPNGEIRGQILLEEDKGMMTKLDGTQETPAVTVNGKGMGFFMLQKSQTVLSFHVVFDSLTGPLMGAHLHRGGVGQSGIVVEDLTTFVNGNTISGKVNPSSYLAALLKDSVYINIHTSANPNGEIRGQLRVQPYLHFDAKMDTAQETHMVMGNTAMGLAVMRMNYTFDTLWYDAMARNLTGPIQDAHFHKGGVNVSGGVVVGIPSASINNNMISGYLTGTQLTDSLMMHMLEGNIYLNAHTTANPSGEIRGQVYRTVREGYTYHINAAQEVPQNNSTASGTGMVSVDRDQTNAHYMMVVNGLNNFSMAHFHNNVKGQNGGVIFDLSPKYNNGGIFGYWYDSTSSTPFNTGISNKFRKDSVYVNFHTTANPNGEIRGDVSRKLCNDIPVSVRNLGNAEVIVKLYPNPADDQAVLDIMSNNNAEVSVKLIDVTGRTLWTNNMSLTAGMNRNIVPLSGLQAGMYFLQVNNGGDQISYRLIKK
ncbi:MAG: CHRD domain-containing protein [Sphingobacteriales bacterium]|nr:MAG: CHRD domain-containing protein [Sphingobacteriales bacterium]